MLEAEGRREIKTFGRARYTPVNELRVHEWLQEEGQEGLSPRGREESGGRFTHSNYARGVLGHGVAKQALVQVMKCLVCVLRAAVLD